MLQGKRTRRTVAATLLTILLTNTFAPGITYALTAGPTAPEATSFEPVDTTDMVNLQTGNFVYNIPLLEVPSPEGGYPLSLSYHAGIQTNVDASWVGLGWTLNPGAISRLVNGYPDDWQNIPGTVRNYWNGGTTSTYSFGITIGLYNTPLSVTAGLSFSRDTYYGFGTGLDFSAGFEVPVGGLSLNLAAGVGPQGGGGGLSAGIGIKSAVPGGLSGSLSTHVSTNFVSTTAGFSGGIGVNGTNLMGASIATNSIKPSLMIGGITSGITGSKSGSIQTQTSGWGFGIPTPVPGLSLSLSHSKTRYFSDETTNTTSSGSLYSGNNGNTIPDNTAFDTYALLEDPSMRNPFDFPNASIEQGGAKADFDDYEVTAQGLSGNIRPYQFQGQALGQNWVAPSPTGCSGQANCTTYNTLYYMPRTAGDPPPAYRFINDFSNTYQQDETRAYDPSVLSGVLYNQALPFDPNPVSGAGGFVNNHLAGSRNVSMTIDVKPYNINGYSTANLQPGEIEGFTITNESGVKYIYGLPAYSWGEEAYQERIDQSHGRWMNRQTKAKPYAYTWYLTSIVGPDYVDRDGDQKADNADWGYWVNFEYGKWSPDYIWRNPSEGYNADEDNEWQGCSQGHKEIYYLNAIRTRTHVALFEKEVRTDGLGESTGVFTQNTTSAGPYYTVPGAFDNTSATTMRLRHVYLLNAADAGMISPSSGSLNPYVLDNTDVDAVGRGNLESKSIRVFDLNYDYSLAPGTSNSFTTPGQLQGKLTLQNLVTRGKGGLNLLPATQFQYELGSPVSDAQAVLHPVNGTAAAYFVSTNPNFNLGDMVTAPQLGVFCGVITSPPTGSGSYTYTLANCQYTGAQTTTTISQTKNPPYNKDAYDAWGMYKSDLSSSLLSTDNILARQTSNVSAPGTDAWSLHGITTALGSVVNINYESDSYFNSSLPPNQQSLVITQMVPNTSNNTLVLTVDKSADPSIQLSNSYKVNDPVSAVLLQEFHYGVGAFGEGQDGTDGIGSVVTDTRTGTITFGDQEDNANPNRLGWGYGLDYYINQPVSGTLTVNSINDNNNTITVNCPDQFLMGEIGKTISLERKTGSSYPLVSGVVYIGGSNFGGFYGGNLFIKSTKPLNGGGVRVKSLSLTDGQAGLNGQTGLVSYTNYGYNDNTGNSSGVSSYTPSLEDPLFDFPSQYSSSYAFFFNTQLPNPPDVKSLYYRDYRRVISANNASLFAVAQEVPAPGVMYGTVTVSKQVKNSDDQQPRTLDGGSNTQYQMEVFKGNMVGRYTTAGTQGGSVTTTNPNYTQSATYLTLGNFTSAIGNVKKIIQYDNNGKKLTETDYNYLHDNLMVQDATAPAQTFLQDYKALLNQYGYQGYIAERFSEVKLVGQQPNPADDGIKATFLGKEEYPTIPLGQTVINYVNGTKTTTQNLTFDFYSGAVTQSLETDAYGNAFRTDITPAYTVPAYSSMGLALNGNKNMLTQVAETKVYKVQVQPGTPTVTTPLGLASANVNTWSNSTAVLDPTGASLVQNDPTIPTATGNIWRMQTSYNWMPGTQTTDGLTPYANFADFIWANPTSSDSRWVQSSAITKYDVYSKALEATDIDGNYAATHLTYGENRVMLTGGPANYYEIAYSGAEDAGLSQTNPGFIQAGQGTATTAAAHTGAQSLQLNAAGNKGFIYSVSTNNLVAGKTYVASAWVKSTGTTMPDVKLYYDLNGGTPKTPSKSANVLLKAAGSWSLITLIINGSDITPNNTLNVWCRNDDASINAYVDDMRFQPLNASTTAYVYDPFSGELTHILDNNNLYTRFDYDQSGRLAHTYREKLNSSQFSNQEYKAHQYLYNYSAQKFPSPAINGPYTKNNCNVSAGYVGSAVQVTFPQGAYPSYLSAQDANTTAQVYAQDYANTHGSCTCSPNFTFSSVINSRAFNFNISGTRVNFNFGFLYPTTNNTYFQLGTIAGTCMLPIAQRIVPITVQSAIFNVIINTDGTVFIQYVSGTLPTSGVDVQFQLRHASQSSLQQRI